MNRDSIEEYVYTTDLLDVDIKRVAKSAKIGWLKSLIIIAVWPLIKHELLKHMNPKIVNFLDDVLNGN